MLSPLAEVLPMLISFLCSKCLEMRLLATDIITAFTSAKMHNLVTPENSFLLISRQIRGVIDEQHRGDPFPEDSDLISVLRNAAGLPTMPHAADGPLWVTTIVSCLIVLSDCYMFSHQHSMDFFNDIIDYLGCNENPLVVTLRLHTWKCVMWAYCRIPLSESQVHESEALIDRRSAYDYVERSFDGRLEFILAASLLHRAPGDADYSQSSVQRTESIVNTVWLLTGMLKSEHDTIRRDAVLILTRITTEKSEQQAYTANLSKELYDGTILRTVRLEDMVRSLPTPALEDIMPLDKDELAQHWDTFLDLLEDVVQQYLRKKLVLEDVSLILCSSSRSDYYPSATSQVYGNR
jgi:hypothetical protein